MFKHDCFWQSSKSKYRFVTLQTDIHSVSIEEKYMFFKILDVALSKIGEKSLFTKVIIIVDSFLTSGFL